MNQSTTRKPPLIEKWTTEDVHQWLTTEVKVQQSCADRFTEEEVSGACLVSFDKQDILELGIKHGPAVKITAYLESLKKACKHQSEFPEYVEKWTKEQVSQWLEQHVNVYSKYAERLREEDVSGDCLVCFGKQDLVDLDVKGGPAVRIISALKQLNQKPEPTLQPITDQKEAAKPTEPGNAQAKEINRPESYENTESKRDGIVEKDSKQIQLPFDKTSEKKEIQQPKPQNTGVWNKGTVVVKFLLLFIHHTTSNIIYILI